MWMTWRESSVLEERLRFVARLLDEEPITDLCESSAYRAKPDTRFSTVTSASPYLPF
jgi:hypothetical protein